MVYQDIQSDNNSDDQNKFSSGRPPLLDRFFSFLIDYLVFSPFVSFITYLLFKDAILYWKTNPTAPEQGSLIAILVFSLAFLFSVMQATFITLWKATPGQFFLKIQVQFEQTQGLIFWRALLRQMGFCASPLLLGIPWLAMLSHPQHKAFYDRLADCQIVTLKRSPETFSFETEGRYWRSLLATLILFVGFLFGAVMWMKYDRIVQRVASFHKLDKQNFFCEDLKDIQISQRLQMAVAMNLVGQLTDDCLDKEADFVLWKEKTDDLSLAYFAKSLTEENNETEQKYLTQACAQESESFFRDSSLGCQLAKSFKTGDFEQMYTYINEHSGVLADSFKYELSQILGKEADVAANFKKLEKYDTHRLIKKYLLSEMLDEKKSSGRSPASVESSVYDAKKAEAWVNDL